LWVLVETRERWAEAVSVAEKALTLFPREVCGRLYYYHGMALSRLGRAGEAVAAYSNALALDAKNAAQAEPPAPPYCEVLICRAAELEKLERWAEALADYDRILELDPGAQKALRNREEVRKRMTPEKGKPGRSLSRWLSGFRQSRV
jgi:tetratricopeptide (TPR) repeat protein